MAGSLELCHQETFHVPKRTTPQEGAEGRDEEEEIEDEGEMIEEEG
jgi:hypothetical protein